MAMSWLDLLFMHWPIEPHRLAALLPPGLVLETFDGMGWIGIVPFRMSGVRPRFVPGLPGLSAFPELNVRTYVRAARGNPASDPPGVYFFSLDATSRLAVRMARATFHLPYFDASMTCRRAADTVEYRSVRTHRGAAPARLEGRYGPTGPAYSSAPGSLDAFLTERYALYTSDASGTARIGHIDHNRWELRPAWAEVGECTMLEQLGLGQPAARPVLHFVDRIDTIAWWPRVVG
jgi:uncharacterized protein YqjF (DUF2071 family)